MKQFYGFAVLVVFSCLVFSNSSLAGLDLENQIEIQIGDLDLDQDGRIKREEAAKYLFYYFDRDGNEVLTKGEYHRRQPVEIIPYEGSEITVIDLDGDGEDDGVEYNKENFLQTIMIGEYDPEEDGIEALEVLDVYFLRLDIDKSGAIEIDEWLKEHQKHAAKKPNQAPKAAEQERYSR